MCTTIQLWKSINKNSAFYYVYEYALTNRKILNEISLMYNIYWDSIFNASVYQVI